jgi:hypothetical protein
LKINRLICAALFVTALTACGARETSVSATSDASTLEPEAPASPARIALGPVRALETPAGERSAEPFVTIDSKGAVLLTWLQRAESGATLWFTRRAGEGWSAPAAIVESDDLFVNWADFPSITSDNSGRLLAHWLQKRGSGSYAYDVRLASSRDGGATWSPSIVAHDDGTETEHGFVSMLPHPDGARFAVVWLDGRNMKESNGGHGEGSMTLRYAALDPATMKLSDEAQLDERTCECCQTSMAMTPRGPVVAYRDRSEAEIRDIAVVRWMGERWSAPSIVHPDGWEINGCPVNGPQIAAAGDRVAVAWFSAAGKEPRVQVAFSDDGGASFAAPVRVDDGKAIGRVDVLLDGSGAAVVTWLEEAGKTAIVRARTVGRDGWRSDTVEIARTESSRSSGVPRIASDGRTVYFTWTEHGANSRVRVASSDIREVSE